MTPPRELIHVDAPLDDAAARFAMCDQNCLIVVNGDEVVGLLQRDSIEGNTAWRRQERLAIADLMLLPTAICRAKDNVASVRALLDRLGRDTALVLDQDNQLIGMFSDPDHPVSAVDPEKGRSRRECPDRMGGRVPEAPYGDLKVYTQRPHINRDRSR